MVRAVNASYAHGGQKVTIIARTSAVYWQVPKSFIARPSAGRSSGVACLYADHPRAAVLAAFTTGSGRSAQPGARVGADPCRTTGLRNASAASDRRVPHDVVDHQVLRRARTAVQPGHEQLPRPFRIGS